MELERIEELIRKSSLTADERAEIRAAADEIGLKYTIKKGKFCSSCYEKILMGLFEKQAPQKNSSIDGYTLQDVKTDVYIGGKRINNSTIKEIVVGDYPNWLISQFFEI